jgi:RHS repeat-associated protein
MRNRCAQHFTGAPLDAVTFGYLLGNGYRMYLPSLNRFGAPDSLSPFQAGGFNAYVYCGGNPVNRVDPSGHMNIDLGEFEALQRVFADNDIRSRPAGDHIEPMPREPDSPIAVAETRPRTEPPPSGARPPKPPTPTAVVTPSVRAPTASAHGGLSWRHDPLPPDERALRIQTAKALLESPPIFDQPPIFKAVPPEAWETRGYQQTLMLGWTVQVGDTSMLVRAHVHYAWASASGTWSKFGGHAWISGVKNWQYPTSDAVVFLAPNIPPPPSRAAWSLNYGPGRP